METDNGRPVSGEVCQYPYDAVGSDYGHNGDDQATRLDRIQSK